MYVPTKGVRNENPSLSLFLPSCCGPSLETIAEFERDRGESEN